MALVDQTGPRGAGVGASSWRGRAYLVRVHVKQAWQHPANAGGRLQAIFRVLTFYFRGYLFGKRTVTPLGDHFKIWADTNVTSTTKVVVGNPPDWAPMQVWKRRLGPSSLFVDVGANVGTYSLWAAELGADVIAIEPNLEARTMLLENAALNYVNLEVHSEALADSPGTMRFTEGLGTMNHLMPGESTRGVEVKVTTLDAVLGERRADGVKIDVEGAERLVLEGAPRAMAEGRIPVIQMEWNEMAKINVGEGRSDLSNLLRRFGYRMYTPDNAGQMMPLEAGDSTTEDIFAVLDGA